MELPNQVISIYPPTLVQGSKRYAVFSSKWYEVNDNVTLSDLMKIWVRWSPKQKEVLSKEGSSWQVASSKPGKFYAVTFRNGVWGCQCSGFSFRRECRHVNDMKKKHGKNN